MRHCLGVGGGRQDHLGTAHFHKFLRWICFSVVDKLMCAQLLRERNFVLSPANGHRVEAHLARELDPKMSKTS